MVNETVTLLFILGAAQGLFLAVLLAGKRTNTTANRILAVAMVAFAVSLAQDVYYRRELYRAMPHFIGVGVPLIFIFGPILYLYAKAVSEGATSFRRGWLLHFLPFALATLYLLPFYLQSGAEKAAYLTRLMREGPPGDVVLIQNLYFPHGITYVVLTILLLRRHRAHLRDTHSFQERVNLAWLRNLTIAIVAVWAVATAMHVLAATGLAIGRLDSTVTSLAVAVMIYGIGYFGLKQPEIFHPPNHGQAVPASTPPAIVEEGGGYEKSGLTQAQAETHLQTLLRVMKERQLYKDSMLTLQDLAEEMAISQHHLSQVINMQLGKNFYDFVNAYRAEEAMQRLRDPRSADVTILTIALEAGFNSKSSFNTFFKKYTGVTPSQYRTEVPQVA